MGPLFYIIAPTNANRSFQPSYGPAARDLAGFDSMTVRATDGSETLLKHTLPVLKGAEPRAALTRHPTPAPVRQLRDFNAAPRVVPAAPADRPLRRLE